MKVFTEEVALVTGAGSGIGRSVACLFAERGARVIVADLDDEGGEGTAAIIRERSGDAHFVKCDVSQADQVEAMAATAIDRFGRLDFAHNNAGGTTQFAPILETTEEDWDKSVAVHLKGVWLCMREEIRRMRPNGGSIVNTASIAGMMGMLGAGAYTASKHGVIGLTKVAAMECGAMQIRVNAVCPGGIRTPPVIAYEQDHQAASDVIKGWHALGRYGEPAEVAETVVWLCSSAASFMTGAAIPIDGGTLAGRTAGG
ncbi:MAG: glucose 1-dehydrogenase [Pseudomonadota bacterium]